MQRTRDQRTVACVAVMIALLLLAAACGQPEIDKSALWMPPKAEYAALLELAADTDYSQEGWVVLRLAEDSRARLVQGKLTSTEMRHVAALASLERELAALGVIRVERLFEDSSVEEIDLRRQTILERHAVEIGDLNLYFMAITPVGVDRVAVARALNALDIVAIAHAKPQVAAPAVPQLDRCSAATCADRDYQHYLDAAPRGVAARDMWCFAGGRGNDVTVYDVEGGWNLQHAEFGGRVSYLGRHAGRQGPGTLGDFKHWSDHGTAVLGEILSADDGAGTTGIVPEARAVASDHQGRGIARAVDAALDQARPGDVLLLEVHIPFIWKSRECTVNQGQCGYLPAELFPAVRSLLARATREGVSVVEAAGNGSQDLDSWVYLGLFDRRLFDSGAIMVGALEGGRQAPAAWSNFGSRVDAHAFGGNVVTSGYGNLYRDPAAPAGETTNLDYTASFSGTSSASPVITGMVASLQGLARARGGSFEPRCLRNTLVATGLRPAFTTLEDHAIGVFPRPTETLRAIGGLPAPPATPPACLQTMQPTLLCTSGSTCASGLCQIALGGTRCATPCTNDAACAPGESCRLAHDGRGEEAGNICVHLATADETACLCRATSGTICGGASFGTTASNPVDPDPSLVYADQGIDWRACRQSATVSVQKCLFTPAGGCSIAGDASFAPPLGLLVLVALSLLRTRRRGRRASSARSR